MAFKEGAIVAEHYQLKKQLGTGSFGDVWLAHNLLADIDVAIKFYGALDSNGLEEFRNEFKVAYKLRHPNLLNINHFDVFQNCPYLVMPYCANGSASQYVGKLSESQLWTFVLDVSGGLAFLHSQQPPIVHQDIKPDNILITSENRFVISDFGISRSFRSKMSRTNNNTSSSGTIAYMGPERFSEKPIIVLASDIWAFGMTLYELMTGDVLWEGMGGCVQLNGARIPEITGNYSKELCELVKSCLAADTWNRPTAIQIHEYASAYLQNKTVAPIAPKSNNQPVVTPRQKNKSVDTPINTPINKPINNTANKPINNIANKPINYTANNRHSSPSKDNSNNKQSKYVAQKSQAKHQNTNLRNGLIIGAVALLFVALLSGIIMYFNDQYDEQNSETQKRIEALKSRNNNLQDNNDLQSTPATNTNQTNQSSNKPVEIERIVVKQKADDRIYIAPSKSSSNPAPDYEKDDAAFYNCVSVNDYETYLNSFPKGRHRAAAQNAINTLLGRNTNIANGAPIVNQPPARRIQNEYQETPTGRGYSGNAGYYDRGGQRDRGYSGNSYGSSRSSGGGSRSSGGGQRSSGSSHRHSH